MADEEFVVADGEVGPGCRGVEFDLGEELEGLWAGFDVEENPTFVEGEDVLALSDH